jgi:hypothetical protein
LAGFLFLNFKVSSLTQPQTLKSFFNEPYLIEEMMMRSNKNDSIVGNKYTQIVLCFFSILLVYVMITAPTSANAQSVETWKLVKREYPVLPAVVTEVRTGRNAGSFIKVRRTQRRNEVVYIRKSVVRGRQECLWVSNFIWNDNLPAVINTGRNYNIALEANFVRRQGQTCGMGRISVTFGNRAEPLRDRAPNVVHVRSGLASPPGGIASPVSTEVFRVNARPDLPQNNMFTVAIHISDGGVTDQVVALYVYQKAGTRTEDNRNIPPVRNNRTGTIVRLQSLNFPGLFIRHRNFLGELTRINSNLDRQDASFRIVPGLANSNLISFESVNYPGYYLRHQGFRIKLARRENNDLFRKDATFKRVPGLANRSMVSFESYNYPGHYIRHRNYHLYLERGNTNLFRQDATFGFSAFGR